MAPDTELVRRYQAIVGPHAFALRTVVSFLLALVLGVGHRLAVAALAALRARRAVRDDRSAVPP